MAGDGGRGAVEADVLKHEQHVFLGQVFTKVPDDLWNETFV